MTVRARRGVLLAAGGFPNDVQRRRALFPRTPTGDEHWTLAPPETTGDGIDLGESVGGRLDTALASPAAWCPVSLVPYRSGRVGVYPHIVDRGKPGLIGVLSTGKRFVNEADGYYQYTTAMIAGAPAGEEVASWLICDHAFQRRYPFGMAKPFPVPTWPYVRSGYLTTGRTIEELAARCGIDPVGLATTVAEFNRHARVGEDPEFDRGTHPVQPRLRRPGARAEPVAGPDREAAVLRDQGAARQLRHVRRAAHRPAVPGARRRRRADPRAVRRRQRPGQRDGRALPVGRDQHRPGDDVRLHRRPARRRRHRYEDA